MPQARFGAVARAALAALACTELAAERGVANGDAVPLPAVPWQPGPERYWVDVVGAPHPTLSLYPPDGAVGVSTGPVLRKALGDPEDGGERWYFVELYDHMCPHCWYAVPIVTDVASAFLGNPRFQMASLNCHVRANAEVCFFLEVISGAMDYPTFLLCPPHKLKLGPFEVGLIKDLPPRAQGLLQHLGGVQKEAFMQLMRCQVRYQEHVKKGEEDPFLSAQAVAEWVMHETGLQAVHSERLTAGADFVDRAPPNPSTAPGRPGWLRDDKIGEPGVPAWVPGQRWFDAIRGFVALLHHGYRENRHQAAVDSAMFLARAFPVKGMELAQLSRQLQENGASKQPAYFQQLLKHWAMDAGISDHASEEDRVVEKAAVHEWEAEEESLEDYRTCDGSPCVMWTLLHVTLTAVAARGISGQMLLGDKSFPPDGALVTIPEAVNFVRLFVENFLTCKKCKENFLRDFDSCEYGRCQIKDFRDLTLWLWRAHNAVSLRVAMRHHALVDRRWPMYEDCPTCWRKELVLGGRRLAFGGLSTEALDSPFHTDHVFWHMVRTYVGIQRVAFELSDLSHEEQAEVKAVLERERAIAAGRKPPPPGDIDPDVKMAELKKVDGMLGTVRTAALILVCTVAMSIAGGLIVYECDFRQMLNALRTLDGSSYGSSAERRAPRFRNPEEADADDTQAEDAEEFVADRGGAERQLDREGDCPAAE